MTAIDLLYARRRRASLAQSSQLEKYAYHGTSKANLRAIRAVGLVPQVGDNTKGKEGHDVEAKVCLALDKSLAKRYANKADDGGVVIKVDLEHSHFNSAIPQPDQHTSRSLVFNQRIPPEAIQVEAKIPDVEYHVTPLKRSEGFEPGHLVSAHLSSYTGDSQKISALETMYKEVLQDAGLNVKNVIGYAHIRSQSPVHSHWTYVHSDYRRKGIAGGLYDAYTQQTGVSVTPGYSTNKGIDQFWANRRNESTKPQSVALMRFRLSEAYACDPQLKAKLLEDSWLPSPEDAAVKYGYLEDERKTNGKFGTTISYYHPLGSRLFVTKRGDITTILNQHSGYQDRLKGVGGNWETRWEHHSIDGVKSTGFDVFGLQDHLKRIHGEVKS